MTEDAFAFPADHFDVYFLANAIRTKVCKDLELRMIKGVPMEKQRLGCDIAEIEMNCQMLTKNVSGDPVAFMFNVNESGFQDWADRGERTVIVSSTYTADKIEIPIDRDEKWSSVLICIAADETYLKPLLILPRKIIEKELLSKGLRKN
jgi:hypothetical protein